MTGLLYIVQGNCGRLIIKQLIGMTVLFLERASLQNIDTIAAFFTGRFQIYSIQYVIVTIRLLLRTVFIVRGTRARSARGASTINTVRNRKLGSN